MAFFNAILRDYNPEAEGSSSSSQVLCRVWISSLADLKNVPKSWFLRFNGKLVKKSELTDKKIFQKFTLLTPLHIYCRPRRIGRKNYFPISVNLEFFSGAEEGEKVITVDVEENENVEVLKNKVLEEARSKVGQEEVDKENTAPLEQKQIRLIYAGHLLKDKRTLKSYGIKMEETVFLVDNDGVGLEGSGEERYQDKVMGLSDSDNKVKKERNTCVVCDKVKVGLNEFVVECGHHYHSSCLPQGDKGCVVCEVELMGWKEALEIFCEDGYLEINSNAPRPEVEEEVGREPEDEDMETMLRRRGLLQAPEILEGEDDDNYVYYNEEVDTSAVDALQYYSGFGGLRGALEKWKEVDEYYYLIAAIIIPMTVGSTMGTFWGALAALAMIELLRRRNIP